MHRLPLPLLLPFISVALAPFFSVFHRSADFSVGNAFCPVLVAATPLFRSHPSPPFLRRQSSSPHSGGHGLDSGAVGPSRPSGLFLRHTQTIRTRPRPLGTPDGQKQDLACRNPILRRPFVRVAPKRTADAGCRTPDAGCRMPDAWKEDAKPKIFQQLFLSKHPPCSNTNVGISQTATFRSLLTSVSIVTQWLCSLGGPDRQGQDQKRQRQRLTKEWSRKRPKNPGPFGTSR